MTAPAISNGFGSTVAACWRYAICCALIAICCILIIAVPIPVAAGQEKSSLKILKVRQYPGSTSRGDKRPDGPEVVMGLAIDNANDERLAETVRRFPEIEFVELHEIGNLSPQGLQYLENLPSLKKLWVLEALTDDYAQAISRLTNLRELNIDIRASPSMSSRGIYALSRLAHLESLSLGVGSNKRDLADDQLGAAVLRQFSEIKNLTLLKAGVSSRTMREVGRMKELKVLAFYSTDIAASDFRHLRGLTRLESIQGLPGEATVYCESLTSLNSISDLWGITDEGMRHLSGLTNLRQLRITSDKITDVSLVHLNGLSKLESLELYSPKIDGSGFAQLDQLKELRRLKLRHTNFQPENIRYLVTLTGLEDLDLGWTPIGSQRSLESLKILKELPRLKMLQFEGANENQEMFQEILPGVAVYYLE